VRTFFAALVAAVSLSGCAGYHIGEVKPQYLKDVHSIAIPTFRNGTFLPRIEGLVTNTVIKQFQQDGTYRIATEANADAILKATIVVVGRNPVRSVRGNVLATTEFNLGVAVRYTLVSRDGKPLAGPATVSGATSFFVGTDVTTDERQALPLAAEDLAVRLVSQLSEGW
jgi:hypothetical protein